VSTVPREQRFGRKRPCPVCGGHDGMPRGRGMRCHGFLSDDGRYAHCSREENAGHLPLHPASQTYAHLLAGDCQCGRRHDSARTSRSAPNRQPAKMKIVAEYDFCDEHNQVLYQEVRFDPKDFRLRRPHGKGGWLWNMNGVRRVVYNLPGLSEQTRVAWVEGPKDAKTLNELNIPATTTVGGAKGLGDWLSDYVSQIRALAIEEVDAFKDNDPDGESYRSTLVRALLQTGVRVRLVDIPVEYKDVTEWRQAGATREQILKGIEAAPFAMLATLDTAHDEPLPPAPPYSFTPAFPPDHFVSQFIAYAAECVDAAHEYFEGLALILLAMGTPNVRARLRAYPKGLLTAFYLILIGVSTVSRKSSASNLARDLLTQVLPGSLLADQTSPEAFIEQLAQRPGDSSLWYIDEIGETFEKLQHAKYMAGLRGLLLSLYDGNDYSYKRTSKLDRKGERVNDDLIIERPHLSVLGATTPAIFEVITSRDVRSGFLARFAIIMPTSKPKRRPMMEDSDDIGTQRNALVKWLDEIYTWAKACPRRVTFIGDALNIIDRLAEEIETGDLVDDERSQAMLQRLNAITIKLAMLAAAGRPGATEREALEVGPEDAQWAVTVSRRWLAYAVAFGKQVGETEIERLIDRAMRVVRKKGRMVARKVIAQNVHCTKKTLDEIESTLVDRGEIEVDRIEVPSRPTKVIWRISRP